MIAWNICIRRHICPLHIILMYKRENFIPNMFVVSHYINMRKNNIMLLHLAS